jgi:hypothetical protein
MKPWTKETAQLRIRMLPTSYMQREKQAVQTLWKIFKIEGL